MPALPSLSFSPTDWNANPVVAAAVWRANQLGGGVARGVPSRHAALDAELPGSGWPRQALIELLAESFGVGELRLLMPVLAQLTRAGKPVMWIAPPAMPYAPALADAGIALEHLLLVRPGSERDCWWAIDQALRCGHAGAVLAWLPEQRRLAANDRLRRLQLAATGSDGLCFVFRPAAASVQASPAPLRIVLAPAEGGRLSLTLLKRRGPPLTKPIHVEISAIAAVGGRPLRQLRNLSPALAATLPQAANDAA